MTVTLEFTPLTLAELIARSRAHLQQCGHICSSVRRISGGEFHEHVRADLLDHARLADEYQDAAMQRLDSRR